MRRTILGITLVLFAQVAIAQLRPLRPIDDQASVTIDGLELEWDPEPGRTSYTVEMSTSESMLALLPLKDATDVKFDAANAANVSYEVALQGDETLKPNTRYYWRVIANCPAGAPTCPPVVSDVQLFRTARSAAQLVGDHPIKLTQTVKGDNAKEPAKFAFVRTPDEDTGENENTYTADFALQWKPKKVKRFSARNTIQPTAYLESVLNSNDDSDTAIRLAGGVEQVLGLGGGRGFVNTYVVKLEGDQDLDTRDLLLEAMSTIVSPALSAGYGRRCHLGTCLWEPTVIAAFGRTLERGDTTKTDESVVRLGLDVTVQITLDAFERRFNVPATITLSDTGYYLPNEDEERKNLLSAAIDFGVADDFTVGVSYKHGAEAPEFEGTHSIGLTIGVKIN
ncbi:MAG TPA: hypothetical protein VEU30_03105 [Thermoanaerobaculia bacterium]|nr:hypothetical protein [Thermoanaerobaculia bacterium]